MLAYVFVVSDESGHHKTNFTNAPNDIKRTYNRILESFLSLSTATALDRSL